jgi:hypothetical protein
MEVPFTVTAELARPELGIAVLIAEDGMLIVVLDAVVILPWASMMIVAV